MEDAILKELLDLFRRAEIPGQVRATIAQVLGPSRYFEAKDALLAGLEDPDPVVRDACIDTLADDWQLSEVAPFLVPILEADAYEFVRMSAATGLGILRYEAALPALKNAILDESTDISFKEVAYEAILRILGRADELPTIEEPEKEVEIDWDFVRRL